MAEDLKPEAVLEELHKGPPRPVYLLHGPGEFRMERVLRHIRDKVVPEAARDFNMHVYYGDEDNPAAILETARSYPFMAEKRLVIIRRAEALSARALEVFLPYLDHPVETTCLIFASAKPNFNMVFYKSMRRQGCAVEFKPLKEGEVARWIRLLAKDLGVELTNEACGYLQQVAGDGLREIHGELEKLALLQGGRGVLDVDAVKRSAVQSRSYNIFELMDKISDRRRAESLAILNSLFNEDRDVGLRITGMLHRQIKLLWQAGRISRTGGTQAQAAKALGLPPFLVKKLLQQSRLWSTEDLEEALDRLYRADDLIKSSSDGRLVFENFIIELCR